MSDTELQQAAAKAGSKARRLRRVRVGIVESDKRKKTIKVRIDRMSKHAKYGKYLRFRTILQAHDEGNEARVGDTVEIMECRPISKTKSWRLTRIIRRHAEG
jgi:small subunit ribosomal protein S17